MNAPTTIPTAPRLPWRLDGTDSYVAYLPGVGLDPEREARLSWSSTCDNNGGAARDLWTLTFPANALVLDGVAQVTAQCSSLGNSELGAVFTWADATIAHILALPEGS